MPKVWPVSLVADLENRARVNLVTPGFIIADQNRRLLTEEDGALTARGKQIIDHTPMGRFATAEEMAGAFLYFASEHSRFTTGAQLVVDGGFSASTI